MSGKFFGLYRAVVVSADDPLARQRLRISLPVVSGKKSGWAEACIPPSTDVPEVGSAVWVQFEEGLVERPVWMGRVRG
jgi:Type VI secretion system/phage-baseplate injector OB domain